MHAAAGSAELKAATAVVPQVSRKFAVQRGAALGVVGRTRKAGRVAAVTPVRQHRGWQELPAKSKNAGKSGSVTVRHLRAALPLTAEAAYSGSSVEGPVTAKAVRRALLGTGHYPQETRNPVQESGRNPDFAGDSGENSCKLCTVCKEGRHARLLDLYHPAAGKRGRCPRVSHRKPEFEAVSWTHPVCGERADGMVTLLPPVHNTDGFFIAKMHRKV